MSYPPHSWETIERIYCGDAPMAELARRIGACGAAIYGLVSLRVLQCSMRQELELLDPRLTIAPESGRYRVTYELSAGLRGRPLWDRDVRARDWTAVYEGDALAPAFSRFVARVGWIPEGHPAHQVLCGVTS